MYKLHFWNNTTCSDYFNISGYPMEGWLHIRLRERYFKPYNVLKLKWFGYCPKVV